MGEVIPIIMFGGGVVIWIIHILASTIERTHRDKQREQSRREIAAYVAEGSISPDEAVRMMDAGEKPKKA